MTLPNTAEYALMRRDEIEILSQTRHPAMIDAAGKALTAIAVPASTGPAPQPGRAASGGSSIWLLAKQRFMVRNSAS